MNHRGRAAAESSQTLLNCVIMMLALARTFTISFYLHSGELSLRSKRLSPSFMPTTRSSSALQQAQAVDASACSPLPKRQCTKNSSISLHSAIPVTPSPRRKELKTENKDDASAQSLQGSSDILFVLEDLVQGTLIARPSKRNRSPFVGDVYLESENREAIVHVPNLDMCGKCVPGVKILMKPARTSKGELVGPDAVSAKYGTPKCEFTSQLILVRGQAKSNDDGPEIYRPTWVGAHPTIGERVTEEWLRRGQLLQDLPPITSIKKQFTLACEDGSIMRPDFLTVHEDGTRCLIEVKTVVDTDYNCIEDVPLAVNEKLRKNFVTINRPYVRTALFPSGNGKQKGPDGETVVSSRAIKHVQELTRLVQRSAKMVNSNSNENKDNYEALIVFCVVRDDAEAFRANHIACPSFAKYLQEAERHGVRLLAKRTRWDDLGSCYDDRDLPIIWPE